MIAGSNSPGNMAPRRTSRRDLHCTDGRVIETDRILLRRVRRHRLEGADVVANPNAAGIGAHDKRVVARLKHHGVNRDSGEIRVERLPVRAAVVRERHAPRVAGHQHVPVARVFSDARNRRSRQPLGDELPALPEVVAHRTYVPSS